MLHIHGDLDVGAHAHLGHPCHSSAAGICERDLILAGAVQLVQERLVALTLAPDSRDLLSQSGVCMSGAFARVGPVLVGIALVQTL